MDGTDAKVSKAFERIDQLPKEIVDAALDVLMSPKKNSAGAEWRPSRDNVKAVLADNVHW